EYNWPHRSLRIAGVAPTQGAICDDINPQNYLAETYESPLYDSDGIPYDEQFNLFSRAWKNRKGVDSIRIVIPTTLHPDSVEYMVFVSLPKSEPEISARIENNSTVVFNGIVRNFQKDIRNIVTYDTSKGASHIKDTILSQKMRLQLYAVTTEKVKEDTGFVTLYRYHPLPLSGFEGYREGAKGIEDILSESSYDPATKILTLNNLRFKASEYLHGTYFFGARIERVDFIIPSQDGEKKIVHSEDSATVVPDTVVLCKAEGRDEIATGTIISSISLQKPQKLTATGSAVDSSINGEDERRVIFVKWQPYYNPMVTAYKIEWKPSGDSLISRKKSAYVSTMSGSYNIVIPNISKHYSKNCPSNLTSLDTATICGDAIDTVPYTSKIFDVIVTPVAYSVDSVTGEYKERVYYQYSDTLYRVTLGIPKGRAINNFTLRIDRREDTLVVPLNKGAQRAVKLISHKFDSSGADPSQYGEYYVRLTAKEGENINLTTTNTPSAGVVGSKFIVSDDTLNTILNFVPITQDLKCKELYSSTCKKFVVDSSGKSIDSINFYSYNGNSCGCQKDKSEAIYQDSVGNEENWSLDPNYRYNNRYKNDPCNGKGDSVVVKRTPYGIYKVYLYALNNGRRSKPVTNRDTGAAVVYDSVYYKVVPQQPFIHSIKPSYLLNGIEDTLSINVSGIDTNYKFKPQLIIKYGNNQIVKEIEKNWLKDAKEHRKDKKDFTNAQYKIYVPITISNSTLDTTIIKVYLVNRDIGNKNDTVKSYSDGYELVLVNSQDIQCNRSYPVEGVRATYAMDYIGMYPVDKGYVGISDTIYILFTELHDRDTFNYKVTFESGSEIINSVKKFVTENKVGVIIPPSINKTKDWRIRVTYTGERALGCKNLSWYSGTFKIIKDIGPINIILSKGGVRVKIDTTKGRDFIRELDRICIYTGTKLTDFATPICEYDDTGFIALESSNWVSVVISERNSGNIRRDTTLWIYIEEKPKLYYTNGDTVPRNFTIMAGDTVIIGRKKDIPSKNPFTASPVRVYSYSFGKGEEIESDTIVFGITEENPLIVRVNYHTFDEKKRAVVKEGGVS
ncbi:MAG: hypothetical protein N2053_09355, partial [Chitinispirillaceae bacterium]|nr:hypothetical protein [Chitinispirillaceae bacterium]